MYEKFSATCDAAKETAARLLATQQDPLYAELLLAGTVEDSVLGTVSTVKALLQANWGPTPTTFIQALAEANELMQEHNSENIKDPNDGNIYRPKEAAVSGERACPWCAETIKAAAIICRFCGRDVQTRPIIG